MKKNNAKLDSDRLREIMQDQWNWAHLKLNLEEHKLEPSPLENISEHDIRHPDEHLLSIMMNPDYFGWTCTKLFNTATSENGLELLPMQCAILREMWHRQFPMLIASRGFGKCVKWNTWIVTDQGFARIGDVVGMKAPMMENQVIYSKILGEKGFQQPEYGWNNGWSETIKLTTELGCQLEGTLHHPVRVLRPGGINWVEMQDVQTGDYVVVDHDDSSWLPSTHAFPADLAFALGAIVAHGNWIFPGVITLKADDIPNIDTINNILDKYHGVKFEATKSGKLFKIKSIKLWELLFEKYGFAEYQEVPSVLLNVDKGVLLSFMEAVFSKKDRSYTSNNTEFIQTLQFLLTRLGILSEVDKDSTRITLSTKKSRIPASLLTQHLTNLDLVCEAEFITPSDLRLLLKEVKQEKCASDSFKYLQFLGHHRYYYDPVVSLQNSHALTFDVHIPNGHSFISNGMISHNSFSLALYAMLRALLIQGRKIVITGAGFRQSKIIFSYAELLWYNSPIFRDLCGAAHDKDQGPHHDTDRWWMRVGESVITALPLGDGSKIRGQRAHDIIADEFASINKQIFEEVVAGFGVVNIDPIAQVKHYQRMKYLAELGLSLEEEQTSNSNFVPNQMIVSGTASFAFNHFYTYWKNHRNTIISQGIPEKKAKLGVDAGVDHKKYSIIRVPVDLLPQGYMDEAMVQRSKQTVSVGIYQNEFGACFAEDSSGFFKRSILEKATPSFNSPVMLPNNRVVECFGARLSGEADKEYIMAVDTAMQKDKFAIVILEHNPDHAKIVYCWTTDAKTHADLIERKLVKEKDFYAYCIGKIRELKRRFNIIHIAMDSQGGGRTIGEGLHNTVYLQEGDQLIWELNEESPLWNGKQSPYSDEPGEHILEMCNFRDDKYMSDANHGMKKDFEQRTLLFPYSDAVDIILADKADLEAGRIFDTLGDVLSEIDEIKDELQMIQHDSTDSGREKWSLPRARDVGADSRLYDDRYASLLMANSAASRLRGLRKSTTFSSRGGWVGQYNANPTSSKPYSGPSWFTEKVNPGFSNGRIIKR